MEPFEILALAAGIIYVVLLMIAVRWIIIGIINYVFSRW